MSANVKTIIEDKEKTPQEFAEKYAKLCEEMGYKVVCSPAWAVTNHGSFELVLQYSIGKIPKVE